MLATMKTGSKILAGFAVALAISIAVGGAGFLSAETIADHLAEVTNERLPELEAFRAIVEGQEVVLARLSTLVHEEFRDPGARKAAAQDAAAALERMDEASARIDRSRKSPGMARLWEKFAPVYRPWRAAAVALAADMAERDAGLARGAPTGDPDLRGRAWKDFLALQAANKAIDDAVDPLAERAGKEMDEARADGLGAARAGKVAIAIAILAGAAVMLGLGVLLSRSIAQVLRGLVAEAGRLTAAVQAGRIDVRGKPEAMALEFQPIVQGMNRIMDEFEKPIRQNAEAMDRISRGDIPQKSAERYQGDFESMKQSLDRCIDAISGLVRDVKGLSEEAVEGKLSARAEADRYQGDFRKVVGGVNATLDAIARPLAEANQVLGRVAQRDLVARMSGEYRGDFARMKTALNATADALHGAVSQVAEAAEQVSSAAGQIASSSQAVASGASEQASSLEETHASLEAMSSQTRQASENAQQANSLASGTRTSAQEGAAAMEQMTGAMEKIRRSAEGTSAIIKDISEIAFQTNLLALNAAVEAARAGEAGRGFAVVAEEVRSLALRAKEAAVKTEELIKESVKQAGEGELTAKLASGKLAEIVGNARKVNDIVAEMAASAKEQAAGIDQVSKAVAEMDRVTQQNAASSEESSSAAEELSSQSEQLAAMVGSFQLGQAGERKPAPGAKAPARPAPAAGAARKNGKAHGTNGVHLRPEEVIPLGRVDGAGDF
jgi:methyl-accepting chemotaxis protein